MSYDIFIKIDGIIGESKDAKHKGEIDVLSWSWGVANPPTATGGGGGAAGKAKPSDLNFSHRIDLASPLLIKACASGQHLKDAVITVQKAGSAQQQFLIVKLADILVTSVQPSVEVSENCLIENVALSFAKIEFVYKEQKPDGTLGSGDKVVWDIKINKVS